MNEFKESLKVKEIIEQTKIDIRTDKTLSDKQKREQLKGIDKLNSIDEIIRRRDEEAWYK